MHLPAHPNLLLADYWDVVFRLTGNRAGVTANADVQVHDHSPFVAFVGIVLRVIQRLFSRGMFLFLLRELWIGQEFFERAIVKNPARAVHVVMLLSADEPMAPAGFTNCQSIADPKRIRGAQRVSIESDIASDTAGDFASITEWQGH